MRPITLTISAFGPYADETILHFDELGEQRLFVIAGPTGSGKTTIFEAILYALYGKLSKKGMDPSSLRCDFLQPTDTAITYVEFVFEIGEKQYRIRRQPKQLVAKKRGEGKKEVGQEVVLECVNHQGFLPLTKIAEVDAKIVELIGLEEEQFKKIVMLPQGAFQEFLISNTKEKIELLRNIFNTGMYDLVLQRLKGRVSQMTGDYERMRLEYRAQCGLLKTADVLTFSEFPSVEEVARIEKAVTAEAVQIGVLEEHMHQADQAYRQAVDVLNRQKQHNEDVMQWQKATAKKQMLANQSEEIEQLKTNIAEIEKAEQIVVKEERYNEEVAQVVMQKQALTDAVVLCEQLRKKSAEAEARHQEAGQEKAHADEAYQHVSELSSRLVQLKQFAQKKALVEELQKNHAAYVHEQEEAERALEDVEAQQKLAEEALQKCQRLQSDESKMKVALSQLNQVLQAERQHFKVAYGVLKRAERVQECMVQEEAAKQVLQEKEEALQAARMQNRKHLAASLAEGLVDGMPCPVCGAIHHPVVAINIAANGNEEALTKERDAAQKEKLRLQATLEQESSLLQEGLNELQLIDASLDTVEAVRLYQAQLLEQGRHNKAEFEALEESLAKISAELQNSHQIEEDVTALRDKQQVLQVAHTEAVSKVAQSQGRLNNTLDEIKQLELTMGFDGNENIEVLERQMKTIQVRYQEANRAFNQAQEEHARVLLEKATAESALAEKKARLSDLERAVSDLENAFNEACRTLFENKEDYLRAKTNISQKNQFKQQVETYKDAWTQIVTTCAMLEERLKDRREIMDLSLFEAECLKLQQALDEANAALSEQKAKCQSNADTMKVIATLLEQFKSLESDYAVLGQLRDVLDGKNQFNMRFETFAQAYYFESMLEHANQRLARMTHGRYSFKRKEAVRDGRKQAGLDLDVMDQYTGRARDVATLSGGESFKASLSLALGLADVVSSESGGVELSTIFIDEGFGTLDDESLDDTVETLLQLQDSGRLVGVISHVAELKERIPAHLVVTTGNRGSHARFEVRE